MIRRATTGALLGIGMVLLTFIQSAETVDQGFNLLFTSNKNSYKDLEVRFKKAVPSWLKGNYIRNGLGRFEWGSRNFTHAFDGYAKLASWKFDGSRKVKFSSKFIKSNFFKASKSQNSIAPYLLFDSSEPPFDIFERIVSLYRGIDNTNVNVFKIGGGNASYLAVSDFWQNYEFHPDSLSTIRRVNARLPVGTFFNKQFPLPSSGHPVREFGTTNHINFLSILNPVPGVKSSINVIRLITADDRELIASIPRDNIPYMHSFGLSKNYAIIFAHPLFVNPWKMVKTGIALKSLDWHPEKVSDIYVVDIHSGNIINFYSDAVFHMHHVNSFEADGKIYVDIVTYPDIKFITSLELSALRDPKKRNKVAANATLRRYTFNLQMKTVHTFEFKATPGLTFVNELDLPVINPNYLHGNYCYVYGIVTKSDRVHLSNVTLAKKDVCRTGYDQAWHRRNHYPSEPWLLPDPLGTREDDGILISIVLNGNTGKSYILCLDPHSMKQINTARLPTAIPFSLHGRLFDDIF